jgi:hypothetical protein
MHKTKSGSSDACRRKMEMHEAGREGRKQGKVEDHERGRGLFTECSLELLQLTAPQLTAIRTAAPSPGFLAETGNAGFQVNLLTPDYTLFRAVLQTALYEPNTTPQGWRCHQFASLYMSLSHLPAHLSTVTEQELGLVVMDHLSQEQPRVTRATLYPKARAFQPLQVQVSLLDGSTSVQ